MRHHSTLGSLLPSEQMMAGVVVAAIAFLWGFGSILFWSTLGLGAAWFFHGLGRFVRVGGLRGELARERRLNPDV